MEDRLFTMPSLETDGPSSQRTELSVANSTGHEENSNSCNLKDSSKTKVKDMSDSEIALQTLENKLKEVQTMLNIDKASESTKSVDKESAASEPESHTNKDTAGTTESVEMNNKVTNDTGNINKLTVNITGSAAQSSSRETGNVLTPQNEKEVAEAWNMLGLQRCRFCKFSTDDKELFKNHTTMCTPKVSVIFDNGIYTCETCELTWSSKPEFEEHIVCHTTNDPYVCIKCKKAFESRLLTEQHAKADHPSGGSIYGLRGMKKSRKIVEELEKLGKYQFRGKIVIPPTPRNKQLPTSDSQNKAVLNAESKTPSSSIGGEGSSSTPDKAVASNELIEKGIEDLRRYLVSNGSISDVSEKRSTNIQTNPAVDGGKTNIDTVQALRAHLSRSNSTGQSNSSSVNKESSLAPVSLQQEVISANLPIVTVTNQSILKQDNSLVSKTIVGPQLLPAVVSQSAKSPSLASANPFNFTSQSVAPSANVNKNFESTIKETYPERIALQSTNQNIAPQPTRHYQFTEYVGPPAPKPKAITPAVKTSPIPTTLQTNMSNIAPATVQANTTPILLIPIPSVFNNPPSSLSNVLIPIQTGNQGGQSLVKSFVNYSMPSTGPASVPNPVTTANSMPSAAGNTLPVSKCSITCASNMPVMVNTFDNSNPKLVITSSALGTQPGVSPVVQSVGSSHVQGQPLKTTVPYTAAVMKSVSSKNVTSLTTASIANASISSVTPVQSLKTLDNTSLTTSTKHDIHNPVPTIEISVLPDRQPVQPAAAPQKIDPSTLQGQQYNLSKRFLFRIKPGHGFVCEACRKFTQDEVIFRRHVWDHFHTVTRSCKFCNFEKVQKKDFLNCSLVSNVVCSLVKKSTNQRNPAEAGATPEKAISVVDDEVISISDEEDSAKKSTGKCSIDGSITKKQNDVIVVDEEEEVPQIKIAKYYSLSGADKQKVSESASVGEHNKGEKNTDSSDKNSTFKVTDIETDKISNRSDQIKNFNADVSQKTPVSEKLGLADVISCTSDNVNRSKQANLTQVEKLQPAKETAAPADKQEKVEKANTSQEMTPSVDIQEKTKRQIKRNEELRAKITRFEKLTLSKKKEFAFYMCGFDQCSFTSLVAQKYKNHLSANHAEAYNYVCCHCGLKNYTEDTHVRHVTGHGNMKVFLLFHCPVKPCKYKTNLIHMYKAHLLSHKEQSVKCTYCHRSFESPEMLVSHLQANLIKYVSCPSCHFKFQEKDVVVKHIRMTHPDKPRLVIVSSQIVCLERELNFYNPPLAKTMTGEQQNIQDQSGIPVIATELSAAALPNVASIPSDQGAETSNRHSGTPPPPVLTAEIADKRDSLVEKVRQPGVNVQTNTKNVEGPKSLLCSKCNFLSWTYKLHQQHLHLHDEDEPERDKRFVCMYCPKGFDILNQFKTHVSNHVGRHEIKIYSCTLCVFTTSQRYHIIDHCKDNHLGTGTYFQKVETVVSKETSCKFCDFKSRQAEHVQLHEKVVHMNSCKQTVQTEKTKQVSGLDVSLKEPETQLDPEVGGTNKKLRKYHCHYCMEYFKHKADLRAHMELSHLDIENKSFVTFKCKYCHFTSTIKTLIITHIEKKHVDEQIRILRRIENVSAPKGDAGKEEEKCTYYCKTCDFTVDSADKLKSHFAEKHSDEITEMTHGKETIYIPDGNFYKEPIHCPKCSYSNKLRVNILRHIKLHPELVPSRHRNTAESSPSKVTARKTTSKHSPVKLNKELINPFAAVKDAVRELDRKEADSNKKIKQLFLGGDRLHSKLAACFIPLEKDYKCKICQQKIAKKFVLHTHILNHLQIVFFKCQYCLKGDIEQSLISGHIQQEHPLKPVQFESLDIKEVCNQIKEKIHELNIDESLDVQEVNLDSHSAEDVSSHSVVKQSHEAEFKDEEVSINKIRKHKSVYKCSKCEYFARNTYQLALHRKDHMNPGLKKYGCTACGYRGVLKFHVLRHMKTVHPNHPIKITVNNREKKEPGKKQTQSEEDTIVKTSEPGSAETCKARINDSKVNKINSDNITISEAGVFEMKSLYKCKECGEKKSSKWALYNHFKISKCHKPWYRCKACAFTNAFKNSIKQHSKLRHPGKKVEIIELPLCAKIRHIKFPVKQNDQIMKALEASGNTQTEQISTRDSKLEISQNYKSADSANSDVYVCRVCQNYRSESLSKLQFHINTKHQGKPLFCTQCKYKTPLVKHMINHCLNVHKMENAKYTLHEQGARDIGEDQNLESESETSNKLTDTSKTQSLVDSHSKKFSCPECDISKDNIKALRDHMPIHFGYKPFACKYCSAKLQHFSNVRRHINVSHAGKTVKYSMVKNERIEKKLDELIAQVLKFSKQKQDSKKQSEKELIKGDENKVRKKADKRSLDSDEDSLPPKKKVRQLIDMNEETSEESSEEERDAGGLSPVKYRVVREPGTSTKFFQCVQCDYKTDKRQYLKSHLKRKHGKKTQKCPYCDYTAKSISNTYRHIQKFHKGKKLSVINLNNSSGKGKMLTDSAPIGLTTGSSATSSKASQKMVTLQYFCNVCNFSVTGLYHFRQHLATHKEFRYLRRGTDIESRLSCGYCSYMAVNDLDFSTHISSHLDERPYECGHCDYSSYQRKNIQVHLSGCHPDEPEIIVDNRDKIREGGWLKVKQTLLVDFDPQVVLRRLDDKVLIASASNATQSERKPIQKLKISFSNSSPSKASADRKNIFLEFKSENRNDYLVEREMKVSCVETANETSKDTTGTDCLPISGTPILPSDESSGLTEYVKENSEPVSEMQKNEKKSTSLENDEIVSNDSTTICEEDNGSCIRNQEIIRTSSPQIESKSYIMPQQDLSGNEKQKYIESSRSSESQSQYIPHDDNGLLSTTHTVSRSLPINKSSVDKSDNIAVTSSNDKMEIDGSTGYSKQVHKEQQEMKKSEPELLLNNQFANSANDKIEIQSIGSPNKNAKSVTDESHPDFFSDLGSDIKHSIGSNEHVIEQSNKTRDRLQAVHDTDIKNRSEEDLKCTNLSEGMEIDTPENGTEKNIAVEQNLITSHEPLLEVNSFLEDNGKDNPMTNKEYLEQNHKIRDSGIEYPNTSEKPVSKETIVTPAKKTGSTEMHTLEKQSKPNSLTEDTYLSSSESSCNASSQLYSDMKCKLIKGKELLPESDQKLCNLDFDGKLTDIAETNVQGKLADATDLATDDSVKSGNSISETETQVFDYFEESQPFSYSSDHDLAGNECPEDADIDKTENKTNNSVCDEVNSSLKQTVDRSDNTPSSSNVL